MTSHRPNSAQRRFTARFIPLMIGYVVVLLGAQYWIAAWHPTGAMLATAAALPAIPLIGTIATLGLYVAQERDDYIRHLHIVAMLWATGVSLATATMWGFLQGAGTVGGAPLYLSFPFWCVIYALAQGGQYLAGQWAKQR